MFRDITTVFQDADGLQLAIDEMQELVDGLIGNWRGHADAVVLGCTHYPFVEAEIRRTLGDDVTIYDGADGTARNVRATLTTRKMTAGNSRWADDEHPSRLILGYGPREAPAPSRGFVVPNVWNVPHDRVLMMTSGTIRNIMRFEMLLTEGLDQRGRQGLKDLGW
jgi:hypothetical protein